MEWNISDNYRFREASEMFHIDKSAENPHFDGFLLHTIKTMDKVVRYGGNNQVDFFEHPTGDTMWRCTHNQHLCRRFKCYIGGQAFYTLEQLFYSII